MSGGFGIEGVRTGVEAGGTSVARETAAFELAAPATAAADRAMTDAVVSALRGGEPAALTASSSTPMRRPPHAFLVRGPEGEDVRVRIALGPGDGALDRVDGRSRLETRLQESAVAVFGPSARVAVPPQAEAALASALPAAGREVAPFVEVASGGATTVGAMVMGPGLVAYLGLDERGVSASVVAPGEAKGRLLARLSQSAVEVDGRIMPLAPDTAARLGDVLSRLAGSAPERPSLRDDVRLLSSGAIPI